MTKRVLKTSLTLLLVVFASTISSPSSFFQVIKPAMAAGTLTGVTVLPASNLASVESNYDFFFTTGTTGTIKTIEIVFNVIPGVVFNIFSATKYIERNGIGPGTLSVNPASNQKLVYTVNTPVSVSAGTNIRLEIARIIASAPENVPVSITTKRADGSIIDGPTLSSSIWISATQSTGVADNSIKGNHISPTLMVTKTLLDDSVGNSKGWNPGFGAPNPSVISDNDITGSVDSISISIIVSNRLCGVVGVNTAAHQFSVLCSSAPSDGTVLRYTITKLPQHVITSFLSESSSQPVPSSSFGPQNTSSNSTK